MGARGSSTWTGVAMLVLALSPAVGEELRELTPTEREAVEWFEALEYGPLRTAPYVRVIETGGAEPASAPPRDRWGDPLCFAFVSDPREGVLLSRTEDAVRLLGLDLRVREVPLGADRSAMVETADLRARAARLRDVLREPVRRGALVGDGVRRLPCLPVEAQAWVVAYACLGRGSELDAIARDLFEVTARKLLRRHATLARGLDAQIAPLALERLAEDLREPAISRTALARGYREHLRRHPVGAHARRARELLLWLERMIAEDESYAATARVKWAGMSLEERIDDAIHRLRDQPGFTTEVRSSVYSPLLRELEPDAVPTPAEQLFEIGFEAIPALIARIGDRRPTRACRATAARFGTQPQVMRVEDCALDIIHHYTGERVGLREGETSAAARARLDAWWRNVAAAGEEAYLADRLEAERGDFLEFAAWRLERLRAAR